MEEGVSFSGMETIKKGEGLTKILVRREKDKSYEKGRRGEGSLRKGEKYYNITFLFILN